MIFIISYELFNDRGDLIDRKRLKVKNCISPMHSKEKLKKYLSDLYWDYHKLVVIEVVEVKPPQPADDLFGDLFGGVFGDIFNNRK